MIWRKGVFVRPFSHLDIWARRVDSPPLTVSSDPLSKSLIDYRRRSKLTQDALGQANWCQHRKYQKFGIGPHSTSKAVLVRHPLRPSDILTHMNARRPITTWPDPTKATELFSLLFFFIIPNNGLPCHVNLP